MQKNWVLVGSIGKAHGVKGWVKINSYTDPLSNILCYQPWYLTKHDKEVLSPIEIRQHQIHNQRLIVQFENCQTPESAQLLTKHKIYVQREQFLPLGAQEYYWTDLEGLKVYTLENVYLGIIQTIFATGSNDVFIIEGKKRVLIPFLPGHTIKSIDLEQQVMVVDWDPNF
ncbi:MAG: ribosome maturation factor RimM [Rickettsiella sp.]|nr:ribosome maturation factor RimM [Rickettsiella sp.]